MGSQGVGYDIVTEQQQQIKAGLFYIYAAC